MDMEEKILQSLLLRQSMKNVSDELLADMIHDCILEVKDAIHYKDEEELPEKLCGVVKDIVAAKVNQDGVEGIASESQSCGGSTSYLQDITPATKRKIYRCRRLLK